MKRQYRLLTAAWLAGLLLFPLPSVEAGEDQQERPPDSSAVESAAETADPEEIMKMAELLEMMELLQDLEILSRLEVEQ